MLKSKTMKNIAHIIKTVHEKKNGVLLFDDWDELCFKMQRRYIHAFDCIDGVGGAFNMIFNTLQIEKENI